MLRDWIESVIRAQAKYLIIKNFKLAFCETCIFVNLCCLSVSRKTDISKMYSTYVKNPVHLYDTVLNVQDEFYRELFYLYCHGTEEQGRKHPIDTCEF